MREEQRNNWNDVEFLFLGIHMRKRRGSLDNCKCLTALPSGDHKKYGWGHFQWLLLIVSQMTRSFIRVGWSLIIGLATIDGQNGLETCWSSVIYSGIWMQKKSWVVKEIWMRKQFRERCTVTIWLNFRFRSNHLSVPFTLLEGVSRGCRWSITDGYHSDWSSL